VYIFLFFFGLVRCVSMWRARSSSLKWEKRHGHCFWHAAKKKKSGKKQIVEIGISLRVDWGVRRPFIFWRIWMTGSREESSAQGENLRTDTIWD
jgi:hypothetical protein